MPVRRPPYPLPLPRRILSLLPRGASHREQIVKLEPTLSQHSLAACWRPCAHPPAQPAMHIPADPTHAVSCHRHPVNLSQTGSLVRDTSPDSLLLEEFDDARSNNKLDVHSTRCPGSPALHGTSVRLVAIGIVSCGVDATHTICHDHDPPVVSLITRCMRHVDLLCSHGRRLESGQPCSLHRLRSSLKEMSSCRVP